MICLLHGWLLEGSGSNLWTRSIITALARQGETVHLVCQENHPDRYAAIAEAHRHRLSGEIDTTLERETEFPGKCILHQPDIGRTLPVFVRDRYEEYDHVVPMVELPDDEIEMYIARNVDVVLRIVDEHDIAAIHANHAVLMPVVAERVKAATGVPYAIMPHGSGIEYAVKKDDRFRRYAASALEKCGRVFVIGSEMRDRVTTVFPELPHISGKFSELHLGVDSSQFEPVDRSGRAASIRTLCQSLRETPRGKKGEQSARMTAELGGSMDRAALGDALSNAGRYDLKRPDADVEKKLTAIDWSNAPVLIFTGRIISPKGIHNVIAALPLILERVPDLHLVVVGHGPLREPMEALLHGLRTGDRQLVDRIVRWGYALEGSPEGEDLDDDLQDLTRFFARLEQAGTTDRYFSLAMKHLRPDTVVFTGYLTHRELRYLFPCCDAGVFPSVVREAGPLVFLESLASGSFPLGTYFGGMAASIDAVAGELPSEVGEAMKLSVDNTVDDIISHVPDAIALSAKYGRDLARIAQERYDWKSVARTLHDELHGMRG